MNMACNNHASGKAPIRQDLSKATLDFKVHREERRGP
jgi:hypothetical protein